MEKLHTLKKKHIRRNQAKLNVQNYDYLKKNLSALFQNVNNVSKMLFFCKVKAKL